MLQISRFVVLSLFLGVISWIGVLPYRHNLDYIADSQFTYETVSKRGPDHWYESYPQCNGYTQSPIDIRPTECDRSYLKPIKMSHTDYPPKSVEIINDRYTVKFRLNWNPHRRPFIHGEELNGRFIPREVHFHWGQQSDRGSEHMIDGQKFALEMHMVNFNARYGSVANATNKPDGILVISQLFRSVKVAKKQFFSDFISQVRTIESQVLMTTHLCKFALDELIQVPSEEWNYVIYPGSFTTPPCYEQVTWIVFLTVQPVSESQLLRLRQLMGLNGQIGDNFRPVQDTNSRRNCLINTD